MAEKTVKKVATRSARCADFCVDVTVYFKSLLAAQRPIGIGAVER